jgi:hypothetical protein
MNFFKKIKLYREYKKIIKENRVSLEANYSIRIDRANRLYTVLNIPEENFGEPYNLRKSDIDQISERFIREYINRLSMFLNEKGLSELYDFYDPVKKIDKYSYLIILGYKPLNTVEYNNFLWFRFFPAIAIFMIVSLVLYFVFK